MTSITPPKWTADLIKVLSERVALHNESKMGKPAKLTELKRQYANHHRGNTAAARETASMEAVDRHLAKLKDEPADVVLRTNATSEPAVTPPIRRQRVVPLLVSSDFSEALAEAKLATVLDEALLRQIASSADEFAQRVLAAQLYPSIPNVRYYEESLQTIGAACRAALERIALHLDPSRTGLPDVVHVDSLSPVIHHTIDPLILALRGGAARDVGEEQSCRQLAATLLGLEQIANWAESARDQFHAGIAADKVSRSDPAVTGAARNLGFKLVETYELLTGRAAARSRTDEKVTGPLIHYLEYLFGAARGRVPSTSSRAAPKKSKRDWEPSRETLSGWITAYRKDREQT